MNVIQMLGFKSGVNEIRAVFSSVTFKQFPIDPRPHPPIERRETDVDRHRGLVPTLCNELVKIGD